MRKEDFQRLVEGTSDAAFVVDCNGLVVAWNKEAENLFGIAADQAIGHPCDTIVGGSDECGTVCSNNCTVQQALGRHHPMKSFDLLAHTTNGEQWCNVSIIMTQPKNSTQAFAIHIVKPVDLRKRLELVVRDFVVSKTGLPADEAVAMMVSDTAARQTELTAREIEILRFLAKGRTTKSIAEQLHISRTTLNNHVQHILHKLAAHTRLEAIRRAEHAGLI